ncbi:MAG: molybdenum cofactor biosynthesis protein MoaE [Oligoflexia bacterium]|nr:molybdenum cofactor biosynthesis protein MoaE [Oligoflexia bacterium]
MIDKIFNTKILIVREEINNFLPLKNKNIDLQDQDNENVGGAVIFEGIVRRDNNIDYLEYEGDTEMILLQGKKILEEAIQQFNLECVILIHRLGIVKVGEMAVWIRSTARHRKEAFAATEFVIDSLKKQLPIWKKECFVDGGSNWVGL